MSGQQRSTGGPPNAWQSKCKKQTTSPYPDNWKKITEVKYCDPLILVRCKVRSQNWNGKGFIVGRAYKVEYKWKDKDGKDHGYCPVVVPCGMETDLASIPQPLRFITSKVARHIEASVIHDYLYGAQLEFGRGNNKSDRKFADELYKRLMKKARVNPVIREGMYRGVRIGGHCSFKNINRYMGQSKKTCCCNAPHKIC